MKTRIALIVALAVGLTVPAFADPRSDAKKRVEFGIKVAQKGLWPEATLQWEKAVKIDETYAAAWNNLAVGYEQLGRFEEAREAYEKAMLLEPNNNLIRGNNDLFREIYDRLNVRRKG